MTRICLSRGIRRDKRGALASSGAIATAHLLHGGRAFDSEETSASSHDLVMEGHTPWTPETR
jgi:hypothetical protein